MNIRINRDVLMMNLIGPAGTCVARLLSFLFIPFCLYVQKKCLDKMSLKTVSIFSLTLFVFVFFLLSLDLIPTLDLVNLKNKFYALRYIIKVLENLPATIFYIISELFSVFITSVFWMNVNHHIGKCEEKNTFKKFFFIAQISLLISALLNIAIPDVKMHTCFIFICFMILLFIFSKFKNTGKAKIVVKKPNSEKTITNNKKLIYIIPLLSILCGLSAGFLDNFTKTQIKHVFVNNISYHRNIAIFILIQSLGCLSIGPLLSGFNYLFLLPIATITTYLCIIFIPYQYTKIFSIMLIFCTLFFKIIKYSIYSPIKEKVINNNQYQEQILLAEGSVSRLGKNISSFIVVMMYSFGYEWHIAYRYVYLLLIIFAIVWCVLTIYIDKKNNKNIPINS